MTAPDETNTHMSNDVAVQVHDPRWSDAGIASEADLNKVLTCTLTAAQNQTNAPDHKQGGEVCVVLTSDEAVQALNRDWRAKDSPTNVLSFPAHDDPDLADPVLGDIVLAFETVTREAREQGKTFHNHVVHLVVHGMLHLLGYDHQRDDEAGQMEALERKILDGLGIADPFETRTPDEPASGKPWPDEPGPDEPGTKKEP